MQPDYPNIPGYELRGILGTGGFASVYLARHVLLDRLVALKVMDPMLARDREFCERFVREARDTAKLGDHANIVTIHDIGRVEDVYYIAMQYLPGPNLKTLIDEGRECGRPLDIVARVACALAHAHAQGFVHRDIKPANILFDEGNEAILSDFGIAKALGRETQLTAVGSIVGTARYMSPEQATSPDSIDHRSDLYSLGVVLYELIAGASPFPTNDPMALMLAHVRDPVPPLPDEVAVCQPLIDRLMAKRPDDRHASAEELLEDIAGYSLEMPACPPSPSSPSGKAAGKATGKTVGKAAGEAVRKASGKKTGRPTGKADRRRAPAVIDEAAEGTLEPRSKRPLFAGAAALAVVLVGGYVVTDPRVLEFVSPSADPSTIEEAVAAGLANGETPVEQPVPGDGEPGAFVSNVGLSGNADAPAPGGNASRDAASIATGGVGEGEAAGTVDEVARGADDGAAGGALANGTDDVDAGVSDYQSLSDSELQRLQRLLDIAELHELVGRISNPPGANAIEAYSLALSLDPGNAVARDALARLQQ